MNALCTNCNQLTKISYQVTYHPKSIQETYIECDECNDHTTCFVTDKKVRSLQKEIHNTTNTDKRVQLQEEVNDRMSRLKKELEST
jgi:hypothetical protein